MLEISWKKTSKKCSELCCDFKNDWDIDSFIQDWKLIIFKQIDQLISYLCQLLVGNTENNAHFRKLKLCKVLHFGFIAIDNLLDASF